MLLLYLAIMPAYVTAINNVCMEIVFAYGTAALVASGQNYGSRERCPFEASASGDLRRGILREVYEKDTEMSGLYGLLSGKIDSLAPVFDSLRLWGLRAWQKSSILSEK